MVKEEESKQVESKQVKKKCDYCLRMGHTKEEYERDQAGGEQAGGDQAGSGNKVKSESGVKSKSGCWVCGESGHKSFTCPRSKWNGKAGKVGRTPSNHETQSNNHCLAHCSIYMGENVAGKAGMVIKAKSCVICLHPNHTADQCYNKENQKKICGVDG